MIEDMRELEPTPEHGNDFIADVGGSLFMLSIFGIITTVILIVIALEKNEQEKTLQAFIFCFAAAATLLLSMSVLK